MKTLILSLILGLSLTSNHTFAAKLLVLGDSLTAGYGIDKEKSYPSILKKLLIEGGKKDVEVLNGGVSGSTTASGISRLKWFLKAKPDVVLIALGANDGLRGVKVESSKANLIKIIKLAKKNNVKIVLAGMHVPPNYGKEYAKSFHQMYQDIAKQENVPLIPFLLDGVAGDKSLNIYDGIHPNEKGHAKLAKTAYKVIKDLM